MLAANQDLARKVEALERKVGKHDVDLQAVLNALQNLLHPPAPAKRSIGFVRPEKK
jgi:seryl-tRNA synthetase